MNRQSLQSIWNRSRRHTTKAGGVVFAAIVLLMPVVGSAAAAQTGTERAGRFAAAAQEFQVPESLLLAISYNESRWEPHGSSPSVDNGFGVMDLRSKTIAHPDDGRGDPKRPAPQQTTIPGDHFTLDDAAAALRVTPETLQNDERQNIRGAAAVLAKYARENNKGQLPGSLDDWYGAVAQYSGAQSADGAQAFADRVYDLLKSGISPTTTSDHQLLSLPATSTNPERGQISTLSLPAKAFAAPAGNQQVDCPSTLNCRFIPAAYAGVDPNDKTMYGNYDPANRPKDMKIKYIIIHDTEGSYESAIEWFQTSLFAKPPVFVSANYVIRSSDGAITEMVHPGDVAWQANDWYVNMHSIGIEHEGFAAQGAKWYTEAMYQSSATLVRYLAKKYNIPLDRQHILGHDNVPTLSPTRLPSQHTDPGPYWDWNHYMELLHAPAASSAPVRASTKVVTISPTFATNQPPVTDCSSGTCVTLPTQGTNLVYLHTQPQASAPLLSDPYMHPDGAPGTTRIDDWSATANAGDQFAVADVQGDWTGVWFGGKVGWFYNPGGTGQTASAAHGKTVTPRPGLTSVPVYGGAFPESSAYPATIPDQSLTPLYQLPAGQRYVATKGKTPTDYFYDATVDYSLPDDHMIVHGQEKYYKISFDHHFMFVKANDVVVKNY